MGSLEANTAVKDVSAKAGRPYTDAVCSRTSSTELVSAAKACPRLASLRR